MNIQQTKTIREKLASLRLEKEMNQEEILRLRGRIDDIQERNKTIGSEILSIKEGIE